MEANNRTIDEGLLRLEMFRRKSMKDRFKLPYTEENAKKYLAAALEAEIVNRSQNFSFTRDLDEQLTLIAKCLTETTGKFGMMLCGGVGNGKSTMMKAIQSLLNVIRIPNHYDHTVYGLRIKDAKSINEMAQHNYNTFLDVSKCSLLGIDDLGTEPLIVMDYGNEKTPIVDLLSKRYENRLFTIISTNLTPRQIRERYGERIADRFNEMMEVVIFKNPSYRRARET